MSCACLKCDICGAAADYWVLRHLKLGVEPVCATHHAWLIEAGSPLLHAEKLNPGCDACRLRQRRERSRQATRMHYLQNRKAILARKQLYYAKKKAAAQKPQGR